MSTLAIRREPLAIDVQVTETSLRIVLADGREVAAPLAWFPSLSMHPTPTARIGV